MEYQNISEIFHKYNESDTEKHTEKYTEKHTEKYNKYSYKADTNINTDVKIDNILRQIDYSDKESLQDMLDETIKLLHAQEIENDKLTIRCREFLKIIEQKHNQIKQLEDQNNTLEEQNNTLKDKNNILKEKIYEFDQLCKKNFFTNYIK